MDKETSAKSNHGADFVLHFSTCPALQKSGHAKPVSCNPTTNPSPPGAGGWLRSSRGGSTTFFDLPRFASVVLGKGQGAQRDQVISRNARPGRSQPCRAPSVCS